MNPTVNALRNLRVAVESKSLCVDDDKAALAALDTAIAALSGDRGDPTTSDHRTETLPDRYNQALHVLTDVLDYLRRLPKVPMTSQLCTRLQTYLDEPGAALEALYQGKREGIIMSTIGLPIAHVTLIKDDLTLRFPAPVSGSVQLDSTKPYSFSIPQQAEISLRSISADYQNRRWVYP